MSRLDKVLDILQEKSKNNEYVFNDLYRIFYKPELLLRAYSTIAPKQGNMTPGVDGKTIDGFSLKNLEGLIGSLKDESYQPYPARREYIPKRNGKKRPLGIPQRDDKVLQEAIKVILEHIYEGTFSDDSFAYRPNRSCHTALLKIRDRGKSTKWWIEGDIEGFFDNIDHNILINILRRRIKDERFLNLIRKFLNAGYIEEWKFNRTFSGAPQGGILSPILSNIYLNELDRYVEELIEEFNSGKGRAHNNEYQRVEWPIKKLRKQLKVTTDAAERKAIIKDIRINEAKLYKVESKDPMDTNFKRIKYFRYADDFLISVIGDKKDAEQIKEKLRVFLKEKLNLTLSDEKTFITHNSKPVMFLGYEIVINNSNAILTDKMGRRKRQLKGNVLLRMPYDRVREFLLKNHFIVIQKDGTWKSVHNKPLTNLDDLEILRSYNSKVRGFYNYYQLANNVWKFHDPYFLVQKSWQKTMANKYRTSASKIREKYTVNGRLAVTYTNKKGAKVVSYLFNGPFKRSEKKFNDIEVDLLPNVLKYTGRGNLMKRLASDKCEWCGGKEMELEMHHVRKLKDLKGKAFWEQIMITRQRKTMALCKKCHVDLHAGRLD